MRSKLTTLAIATSLCVMSTGAFARYYVQPVVKKEVNAQYMLYSGLGTPGYDIVESNTIERDVRDGINVDDIEVTVVAQEGYDVRLKIANRTMRRFSDINISTGRTGFTLDTPLDRFTELTVLVRNVTPDAPEKVNFLDPNPLFKPNSSRYHENVSERNVQAYFSLQSNFKVAYGQASSYDRYMDVFTNDLNQPRRDAWSKWFHTVTNKDLTEYREHGKTGTSGGWWFAIGRQHLAKLFDASPDYTGVYGFFSHENAHSMGFKHDDGMAGAWGWDNHAGGIVYDAIQDGLVKNNDVLPQTNDFFFEYDKDQHTIRFFAKAGVAFEGFERLDMMYDSTLIRVGNVEGRFDNIPLPAKAKADWSKIVINGKIKGQAASVNLVITAEELGLSSEEEFALQPDATTDNYEKDEAEHQQKRLDMAAEFPASTTWGFNSIDNDLLTVSIEGEERQLCRFGYATQGLRHSTLFGYVSGDVCTVGQYNSVGGVKGYSSQPNGYQTINRNNPDLGGDDGAIKAYITSEGYEANICVMTQASSEYVYDGIGYRQKDTGYCVAQMKASNNTNWAGNSAAYVDLFIKDDGLIKHPAWGWSTSVAEAVTITMNGEARKVCRFAINDTEEYGFVNDDSRCTIGENNTINAVKGYSTDRFQVVDAKFGTPGDLVPAPVNTEEWSVCYKEGKWSGVSLSYNDVACGKHINRGKTAYNNAGFGFKKRNGFARF